MRWSKLVPVAILGVGGVAYVLLRPAIIARWRNTDIFEFPLGAIVVALLLWAALGRGRPETPPPPWRRHTQVVRTLPDPAARPYVAALERWLETGENPEAAADVVARAQTPDAHRQERLRAELTQELAIKASRRKRESQLKRHLEGA